jgi:hypothetical protein
MASMVMMVAFALQAAAPASAETPAQSPAPVTLLASSKGAADKMICKRHVRTGTLAGIERTCYTRAEWQRLGSLTRDAWRELQGSKGSTNSVPPDGK